MASRSNFNWVETLCHQVVSMFGSALAAMPAHRKRINLLANTFGIDGGQTKKGTKRFGETAKPIGGPRAHTWKNNEKAKREKRKKRRGR